MSSRAPRRIAIVGAGYRGRKHLGDVAAAWPEAELLVHDIDPVAVQEALREVRSASAAPSLTEVLRTSPDVVVVATSPDAHAEVAVRAAGAGAHVYCEKPWGLDSREAQRIVTTARERGLDLGYGLDLRLLPAVRAAIDAVRRGLVGEVTSVSASWTRRWLYPSSRRPDQTPRWLADLSRGGGGALRDMGIHAADLALHALGYPSGDLTLFAGSSGRLGAARHEELTGLMLLEGCYDAEDTVQVLARHDSGVAVSLKTSWFEQFGRGDEIRLSVHGCDGSVLVTGNDGKRDLQAWFLPRQHRAAAYRLPDLVAPGPQTALLVFLDGLVTPQPPLAPDRDVLALARVLDACYASSADNAVVRVNFAAAEAPVLADMAAS